jgi:hypothetical protein
MPFMVYSCAVSCKFCSTEDPIYAVHALNGLLHELELKMEINKFQKHPKLSCIKIGGFFQNFGNGLMGSFLRAYLLFKVLMFKDLRNTLNIRRH